MKTFNETYYEDLEKRYFETFGKFIPICLQLPEEVYKEAWYLEAIEKAIKSKNPEIDIDGHYLKDVDY